jgi:hypothetical protein
MSIEHAPAAIERSALAGTGLKPLTVSVDTVAVPLLGISRSNFLSLVAADTTDRQEFRPAVREPEVN